jgi:RNA polymerase sigma-70 factor (ECF subfamily)
MNAEASNAGVPNMTTPLSVHRSSFRHTELDQAVLKQRLEGSDRLSSQQQAPVPIVQHKNERAVFDEVFLPHMAEAYRLAQWLTGNAYDAEDVVQDAALRAFRGIKSFGAVNARAWSLTIVRNAAYSWLTKNRPGCRFTDDLSALSNRNLSTRPVMTRTDARGDHAADAGGQTRWAQLPAHFVKLELCEIIN